MNDVQKVPLHVLAASYAQALEAIDYETGEVPAEIDAMLTELAGDSIPQKVEALACVRARYLAEAAACKALGAQSKAHYDTKAARHQAGADRITAYVTRCLQEAKLERVKGATCTAFLKENKSVVVGGKADLTAAEWAPFVRVKPEEREPDKKALAAALAAEQPVPAHVTLEVEIKAQFR